MVVKVEVENTLPFAIAVVEVRELNHWVPVPDPIAVNETVAPLHKGNGEARIVSGLAGTLKRQRSLM